MLRNSKKSGKLLSNDPQINQLVTFLLSIRYSGPGQASTQRAAAEAILQQDFRRLRKILASIEPNYLARSEQEIARAAELGLRAIVFGTSDYPTRLCNISDPPLVIFAKGRVQLNELLDRAKLVAAVVGARRYSGYGRSTASEIGRVLTKSGLLLVSGLAMGIDAAAHNGALQGSAESIVGVSPGIAVLGSGHANLQPRCNAPLADRLERGSGLIITEYEPSVTPTKFTFPARNRIIAGLADAVVVVEAAERSGAAITARLAAQFGRDVWAVPGPIDSRASQGTNRLLAEGAHVFTSCHDFLNYYQLSSSDASQQLADSTQEAEAGLERRICAELAAGGAYSLDELVESCSAQAQDLRASLHSLEQKGLVFCAAGGLYTKPA